MNKSNFAIIFVIFVLAGCSAAPTDPKAMSVSQVQLTNQHSGNVSVVTSGGSETSALGKSQISDADFKTAIENSILETKIFSGVVSAGDGEYKLSAIVTNVEQPSFGFSFTVKMEAAWSLKTSDKKVVWEKLIRSEHTTGSGEAFAGIKRLRLATEGAAKNNIEQAFTELSALKL
jgi:hypothetical protein